MSTPQPSLAQRLQSERATYPALLPKEILVLQAWLRLHENEYDRFDYNIRIGTGTDPGPVVSDSIRQMAIANSQKRIDAVAYKGNEVTLIEVKVRAGFSAIGQLLGYFHVWQTDFPNDPAPKMILVANRKQPDIDRLAAHSGIDVQLVDVDFSSLS